MQNFERKTLVILTILISNIFIFGLIFLISSNQLLLADQEGSCAGFPMTASDEAGLNDAISCFNLETIAGSYTVTLVADIALLTSTTPISNSTSGAVFYLNGDGHTVDGQDIPELRPFYIEMSTTVQMQALTVQGGHVNSGGAGISNEGALWLTDVTIARNNADNWGGGFYNQSGATAVIENSRIVGNGAGSYGGGIYNQGILTITNSHIAANSSDSYGAGLYNCCVDGAFVTIDNSQIYSNTSDGYGAGIYNCCSSLASVIINNSQVYNNSAASYGAGLYNCCGSGTTMTLNNSQVYSNTAGAYGAGLYNCCGSGAIVTFNYSQVYSNTAGTYGAGLYNCCGSGTIMTLNHSQVRNNKAGTEGGGIRNSSGGHLVLMNSTVSGNEAATDGGGILNRFGGLITITNSTVSGNEAGRGGGILLQTGNLTMDFVTLSDNTALTSTGGISITGVATVTMRNSVIANSIGADCVNGWAFNDNGYNLVEDGNCISDATSFSGDPNLGLLADNGGATETHLPLTGSSVIDAIPAGTNGCGIMYMSDQRNRPRPFDGDLDSTTGCDIGAVEVGEMLFLPATLK